MRFLYSSILFAAITLMMASCTSVTSKNQPGTNQTSFPKEMMGTYELFYPEEFDPEGTSAGKVVISSNEMTMITEDNNSSSKLGDSLYLSKIGKTYYLCLGEKPALSVFKVVTGKKEIKFYSMYAEMFTTKEDIEKYFADVEEVKTVTEGEEGTDPVESISYSVTIDDAKLEDYFNSGYASKDPFILKKAKK